MNLLRFMSAKQHVQIINGHLHVFQWRFISIVSNSAVTTCGMNSDHCCRILLLGTVCLMSSHRICMFESKDVRKLFIQEFPSM